jgi:membrane-bound lytic murein transglycosylase B
MQFLPRTWLRWGVRANGDGKAPDPQNIDDAALTAARYLCASGGNLSTARGWWRAVLTYNRSVPYGQKVFSGADAYAKAAAKL